MIISGLSGAGKTTAVQALEEFGFFTIDNLPPQLWSRALELCLGKGISQVVVVTDARTRHFLPGIHEQLSSSFFPVKPVVVFLEADDDVLIRRYGFTRRTHPLHEASLMDDLQAERLVLSDLKSHADVVIDTSLLSAKALTAKLRGLFGEQQAFTLSLSSFGFKHGAPRDADLVLDVRGLPNPFYDPELKHQSGLDEAVRQYIFSKDTQFYELLRNFVATNAALAEKSERLSYAVAIGCTGGFHRSVAVVEALAKDLTQFSSFVFHSDLDKGEGGA